VRGERVPGAGIEGVPMTETGGVFLLGARSANGLSSSMNGEPLNGDVDPKPLVEDTKSPRGGDDILQVKVWYYRLRVSRQRVGRCR